MPEQPSTGPAKRGGPATRPPFAAFAVGATIALTAVTSGIALVGGLGDDRTAVPTGLGPPAIAAPVPAIMAAPTAPVAPPTNVSNSRPVAARAPAEASLPAAGGPSADDTASQRPLTTILMMPPAEAGPPQIGPDGSSGRVGGLGSVDGGPPVPPPPFGGNVPAKCEPADGRLGVDVQREADGSLSRIEVSGLPVPCVDKSVHLVLDMRGGDSVPATVTVSKDRTVTFEPDEPLYARDIRGVRIGPADG